MVSQGIEIIRGCKGLNLVGADLVEVSTKEHSIYLTHTHTHTCPVFNRSQLIFVIVSSVCVSCR